MEMASNREYTDSSAADDNEG